MFVLQPTRRSYGRQRKQPVRFQNTVLNNDTEDEDVSEAESIENVKYIVTAKTVKKRKTKKVPQFSKKEVCLYRSYFVLSYFKQYYNYYYLQEKEVAEWAAGFNSMLDEVEDFPLCVE